MTGPEKPLALIVEDESLIRIVAADAFVEVGFAVMEAGHADEAILIYEAGRVALLFTDVNMPGELNGIDLAERLFALTPGLRIIITSALPVLRSIDHLPARFVSKPYSPAAVSAAALRLLAA